MTSNPINDPYYNRKGGITVSVDTSTNTTPTIFDPVQKPKHYNKGKVECIDAIETACNGLDGFEGACTSNAIKYLWRWKEKGKPIQDLEKAIWYTNRLIKYLEEQKKESTSAINSLPQTTSAYTATTLASKIEEGGSHE